MGSGRLLDRAQVDALVLRRLKDAGAEPTNVPTPQPTPGEHHDPRDAHDRLGR